VMLVDSEVSIAVFCCAISDNRPKTTELVAAERQLDRMRHGGAVTQAEWLKLTKLVRAEQERVESRRPGQPFAAPSAEKPATSAGTVPVETTDMEAASQPAASPVEDAMEIVDFAKPAAISGDQVTAKPQPGLSTGWPGLERPTGVKPRSAKTGAFLSSSACHPSQAARSPHRLRHGPTIVSPTSTCAGNTTCFSNVTSTVLLGAKSA